MPFQSTLLEFQTDVLFSEAPRIGAHLFCAPSSVRTQRRLRHSHAKLHNFVSILVVAFQTIQERMHEYENNTKHVMTPFLELGDANI